MTAKAKAAKVKAAKWKPVPVAVQIRRHHAAVVAARQAARQAAVAARVKPGTVKGGGHAAAVKTAKTPNKAKKHGAPLAVGDAACCSAQAVATALRLAAGPVLSDADVLALYWATAETPDEGQTLSDALSAAQAFGPLPALPLMLGLDFGGGDSHAVTVDAAGGWWSWGEPYDAASFAGYPVIEAVTWQP